ncbi:UDP-glucose iridoid glucosyltransferase [Ziziphus jujuba]|uniref:UDP-glucose iridoid glucosyltransferase n=1 Tax=Ziziphus jujuba TaxID=326968 RepID=A0A6P3Z7U2_ZIZJJ|nr:UDP-glucose iridoid glucosyltransferase [Ziziphus jujuba]
MRKQTDSARKQRLALVPCPYQGHINPILQLGKILQSRGFSITILHTIYNSPNPQAHPDFSFFPIPEGLSKSDISSGDLAHIVTTINDNCKVSFQHLMEQQESQEDDIACIIWDEYMYFSDAVATNLNIPSIIFRTSSAATFLGRCALLQLHARGLIPFQDSILHEMVPELYPLRYKDLPLPICSEFESSVPLIVDSHKIRNASAIIWNTVDCIEQSCLMQIKKEHCPVPIFPIGPMHMIAPPNSVSLLKEGTSCIPWLDKQSLNSVIYVSLGTMVSIGEKEVAEMAWGLANSKQPFLWVIRPGSICGSDWIEKLPQGFKVGVRERGCIVKWAPQKEVLAHKAVGGFWSHCGWNSTLESICEGVPMICNPHFGDQSVNARYVSHEWRVGLELENLERGEIERAITKLILDDEGKDIRARAKDLKEKVKLCTGEGGSSQSHLNELVDLIMSF